MSPRFTLLLLAGCLLCGTSYGFSQYDGDFPDTLPADRSPVTGTTEKHNRFWKNTRLSGGQLTLPFKIRPRAATNAFFLTTDVTLGGYIGATHRIAADKEYFVTVPITAGLAFININNNNTNSNPDLGSAEIVPGLTWSTGLVFQLNQYSLGLLLGKDYASEIGDQWLYNGRLWWSFGIGFTFVH